MDTYRIHLHGPGHSGRAIRYRTLTPSEVDAVEELARGEIKAGSTMLDFHAAVAKHGIERLVVAYTESVTKAQYNGKADKSDEPAPAPLRWMPVDPATFDEQFAKIFTAKDIGLLKVIYRREHVITEEDVDLIMSGKVPETAE